MQNQSGNSFLESYYQNAPSYDIIGSSQQRTAPRHAPVLARTSQSVREGHMEPNNAPSILRSAIYGTLPGNIGSANGGNGNYATWGIGVGLPLEPSMSDGPDIDITPPVRNSVNEVVISSGYSEYVLESNDSGEVRLSCKRRAPDSAGFAQAGNVEQLHVTSTEIAYGDPQDVPHPEQIGDGLVVGTAADSSIVEQTEHTDRNVRLRMFENQVMGHGSSVSPFAAVNGGNSLPLVVNISATDLLYERFLRQRDNLQHNSTMLRSGATGMFASSSRNGPSTRSHTSSHQHWLEQHGQRNQEIVDQLSRRIMTFTRGGNRSEEDLVVLPDLPNVQELAGIHEYMGPDIDDMSYEELLALEEHIGNVCTGLSEEDIQVNMGRLIYLSTTTGSPPEDEDESCCICQEQFNDRDELGKLDCVHVFHYDCIKQWLGHKNICPICKETALSI